jgi:hypothetical protein
VSGGGIVGLANNVFNCVFHGDILLFFFGLAVAVFEAVSQKANHQSGNGYKGDNKNLNYRHDKQPLSKIWGGGSLEPPKEYHSLQGKSSIFFHF